MTPIFKRSIPVAATAASLTLAMAMFGAQAQAQTPLPPTNPAVAKGDQMAPRAPGGTSELPGTAPASRSPKSNHVSNSATPPASNTKGMTKEERKAARADRQAAATNGGTTTPAENNVSNIARTADPKVMAKARADRKAERDAKRMAKPEMSNPAMAKP